MRSGSSAQVKKLVQQKSRIHQRKNKQLAPLDVNEFNKFIRTRWILTKRSSLNQLEFLTGEFLIVTLMEQLTASYRSSDKVVSLNLKTNMEALLKHQNYMESQYFIQLEKIMPIVIKFLMKEFAVSPYFILENIPTKDENLTLLVDVLANNLANIQGMPTLVAQYQGLFMQDGHLHFEMINELYRGVEPVSLFNVEKSKLNNVEINSMQVEMVNDFTSDKTVQPFLKALIISGLLQQPVTMVQIEQILSNLVPKFWQPEGENFGLGHQLALFLKTQKYDLSMINWNTLDRIIAILSLNAQLKNNF